MEIRHLLGVALDHSIYYGCKNISLNDISFAFANDMGFDGYAYQVSEIAKAIQADCFNDCKDDVICLIASLYNNKGNLIISADCQATKKIVAQCYELWHNGYLRSEKYDSEYFANIFREELNDPIAYELIMFGTYDEFITTYVTNI